MLVSSHHTYIHDHAQIAVNNGSLIGPIPKALVCWNVTPDRIVSMLECDTQSHVYQNVTPNPTCVGM